MPHDSEPNRLTEDQTRSNGPVMENWNRTVQYRPARVIKVQTIADVRAAILDRKRCPSPVRAKGSHHSPSQCIVAEGGTALDMTGMNRVLTIDAEKRTITLEAGALMIVAARALEQRGLQFYVNVEVGELTAGSGACCATKDASCYSRATGGYEFGQVSSYAIGFKFVDGLGNIVEVDEQHRPDLLPFLRSSYGLLGVVCEVTFRVKPLTPLNFAHTEYTLDEFAQHVGSIFASNESNMLYLFPFLDRIVVEHRWDGWGDIIHDSWQWRARNALRTTFPVLGRATRRLPNPVRGWVIDRYSRALIKFMTFFLRAEKTSASDQIIEYPRDPGVRAYEFSIWGFEHDKFATLIREYFQFCRDYYAKTGFRTDLPHVSYGVCNDRNALFSYSRRGHAFTLDPVSTGGAGWREFIAEYNEFCRRNGGRPLLNQTSDLTAEQFRAAFGPELEEFQPIHREYDPLERFFSEYFRRLMS